MAAGDSSSEPLREPIDPDVDQVEVARPTQAAGGQGPVVAAVAVGGAIGACFRYGADLLWPASEEAFPWTTLWINVFGSLTIGVFMVVITEVWTGHRLLRPFFGTGVLGGFTTFSTYSVDIRRLLDAGEAPVALSYLAGTLAAALVGVWLAAAGTRRLLAGRRAR